jgi:sugar lactone lactonase YvrE
MNARAMALGVLLLGASALAGELSFSAKPSAVKEGDQARITFTVSAPTDVEVAVLDAKGATVRHLAAGALGKDAPAPFKKDALAQEVAWDGKDDTGKAAAGGPFKARVRLGLKAEFDSILGWDAQTFGSFVVGLAVGAKGELYVLDAEARMKVFSREGKYLRTIMPYPAGLAKERTASVGQLEVDGERLPVVYNLHPPVATDGIACVYPMTNGLVKQNMAFTPRGNLVLVSAMGTYVEHGPMRHLLTVSPEGGAPEGLPCVGPKVRDAVGYIGGSGERGAPWFDHLAASPDGEWIYFVQASDAKLLKRSHAVFRLKWSDAKLGEPFVGQKEAGKDDSHFDDPQGLAVDKDGNLYVCDRGNGRVAVFSADGKRLGQFAADKPEQIAVHPKTGEIYILSRPKQAKMLPDASTTLRKFSAWGQGDPKERLVMPLKNTELIALDPAAEPPVLWVATQGGWNRPMDVIPLVDRGEKLEPGAAINNLNGLECPATLAADPDRSRVLVRERDHNLSRRGMVAVDLASGKKVPFMRSGKGVGGMPGLVFALDRDGNIYSGPDYSSVGLHRFAPDGSPLPFPETGKNKVDWPLVEGSNPARGITVAPSGDIYLLRNTRRHEASQIDVYGPDGKLKKADVIGGVDRGACGVGVDAAGNVYLGTNLKPKDHPFPDGFAGQVPGKLWWFWYDAKSKPEMFGDRPAPWIHTYYNPYLYHWGSIVKFGPAGGAIYGLRPPNKKVDDPFTSVDKAPAGAASFQAALLDGEARVLGHQWLRQGFGPVASNVCRWGDPGCNCAISNFAVDGYGRTFYPNPFRFAVEVLDAGGNMLSRIGGYGNADSRGAKSPVPKPEIAFARPSFVSLAKDRLYVSDTVNQRIVVIRLGCAAEEACQLP